ncbi:MAG: FGGY family carbohydrate kinase [Planctomycetota bacterium]
MADEIFLGLDSSTQGLTGTVIDARAGTVVHSENINFDADFKHAYPIQNGVIRTGREGEVHSAPLLWVDALDLLCSRLKTAGVPLDRVRCIAGSGQQHGSVYLNDRAGDTLAGLIPGKSLAAQLAGIFTRATAPVWMDSSTGAECAEIEAAVGGRAALIRLTGSAAFRRFTGPQIRKFAKEQPKAYDRTACIQLVSSFMASVLAGKLVPIDPGDGAGMNLMNIKTRKWSRKALAATADGLGRKLLPIQPSDTVAGTISPYFTGTYGFDPACQVALFTGDNPASSIGVGMVAPGMAAISLGTSDTMFAYMRDLRTSAKGEGVVFGSPTGDYMSLICMANGSLARERVRDWYKLDWAGFSEALRATPPGNNGGIMLPWFETEIYPPLAGVRRYGLDEKAAAANVRAVVEAQAMALRIHSEWMGVPTTSIRVTGGASVNRGILKVFADVTQARVARFQVPNSAALGAAIRAHHAWRKAAGRPISWPEAVKPFTRPMAGSEIEPDRSLKAVYDDMRRRYIGCEERAAKDE